MVTCRLNVLLPASCNYSGTYWGYVSGLNKLLVVSLQIELITQVFIDIVISAYRRRGLAQENIRRRIVTFSGIRKAIPRFPSNIAVKQATRNAVLKAVYSKLSSILNGSLPNPQCRQILPHSLCSSLSKFKVNCSTTSLDYSARLRDHSVVCDAWSFLAM
jgi:hypothetical protein